jgi:hypothetical protein
MRLLIAFLFLVGLSVGAFGYYASKNKNDAVNINRVNENSALPSIDKANQVCENKCCD